MDRLYVQKETYIYVSYQRYKGNSVRKTEFLTNCAGTIGYPRTKPKTKPQNKKTQKTTTNKPTNFEPYLTPYIKTKSKWIIDLILKPQITILLEENRRKSL